MWIDRRISVVFIVSCLCSLPACVVVPDLAPTTESIPIYRIVERVKCDLKNAISGPLEDAENNKNSRYWFLPGWNAGVDLTLIVNDQSGVSPSVSFIQPLTLASLAGRVNNMSRSASLGVGGGVTTQAIRTEEMSFAVSLKQVLDELQAHPDPYYDCALPGGIDLNSDNLGLKEWLASAFSPLDPPDHPDYPVLTVGAQTPQGPGGGGGGKLAAAYIDKAADLNKLLAQTGAVDPTISPLAEETARATNQIELQPKGGPLNKDVLGNHLRLLEQLQSDLQNPAGGVNAQIKSQARIQALPGGEVKAQELSGALNSTVAQLLKLGNEIQKPRKPKPPPPSAPPLPPISAISHQVQFIVTWNANANPSWTLLHFKGPAAGSGSFFSAQQINTHTLTITLGPPQKNGGQPLLGSDAQALRQSQFLNAAFQTLAPQIVLPP